MTVPPLPFGPVQAAIGLVVAVGLLPIGPTEALAQPGSASERLRQAQSLAVGVHAIDFTYDGDSTPAFRYDFQNPAFGIVYSRPNVSASLALGFQDGDGTDQNTDLRLLDVALLTWGEWVPFGQLAGSHLQAFVPVALHSTYRRIDERNNDTLDNTYAVTVLGLGAGAGLRSLPSRSTLLTVQAMPAIGLATRSFDSGLGSSWLINAEAELLIGPLVGRLGLILGYRYRWQVWNVGASDFFDDVANDLFDYRGQQHLVRLGVTW